MSRVSVAFLVVALCNFGVAIPVPDIVDNLLDKDDNFRIDISHLGEKVYGVPKNSSGARLLTWDDKSLQNPEELGEYVEGDILVPTDGARNGIKTESLRWPKGVVPFVIDGSYSGAHRDNIMRAIAEYHKLTCVRFVPYSGQKDYITIGNRQTGCWSSVGRIGGRQEVNLQNPGCVTKVGTIIHELMHAVGFLHEQSRPERDNYVTINFQNIKSGDSYNFNKASKDSVTSLGVEYDYGSVMHYGGYAFSTNNKPTIVPKRSGVEIGQRDRLSAGDVTKINAMYKCKTGGGSGGAGGAGGNVLQNIFAGLSSLFG